MLHGRWRSYWTTRQTVILYFSYAVIWNVDCHKINRRQTPDDLLATGSASQSAFPSERAISKQDPPVFDIYQPMKDPTLVGDLQRNAKPGITYPTLTSTVKTNFTCRGLKGPGWYADLETGCQQYHRCYSELRSTSFICPPGTLFSQETLICDFWYNVNCSGARALYEYANSRLYQQGVNLHGNGHWAPHPQPAAPSRVVVERVLPTTRRTALIPARVIQNIAPPAPAPAAPVLIPPTVVISRPVQPQTQSPATNVLAGRELVPIVVTGPTVYTFNASSSGLANATDLVNDALSRANAGSISLVANNSCQMHVIIIQIPQVTQQSAASINFTTFNQSRLVTISEFCRPQRTPSEVRLLQQQAVAGISYPVYTSKIPTNFTCHGRTVPGWYEETQTFCQQYYYCDENNQAETFLCPPSTLFSQSAQACDAWYNVVCNGLVLLNSTTYATTYLQHGQVMNGVVTSGQGSTAISHEGGAVVVTNAEVRRTDQGTVTGVLLQRGSQGGGSVIVTAAQRVPASTGRRPVTITSTTIASVTEEEVAEDATDAPTDVVLIPLATQTTVAQATTRISTQVTTTTAPATQMIEEATDAPTQVVLVPLVETSQAPDVRTLIVATTEAAQEVTESPTEVVIVPLANATLSPLSTTRRVIANIPINITFVGGSVGSATAGTVAPLQPNIIVLQPVQGLTGAPVTNGAVTVEAETVEPVSVTTQSSVDAGNGSVGLFNASDILIFQSPTAIVPSPANLSDSQVDNGSETTAATVVIVPVAVSESTTESVVEITTLPSTNVELTTQSTIVVPLVNLNNGSNGVPIATLNSTDLGDLSLLLAQHNVTVMPGGTLPTTSINPLSDEDDQDNATVSGGLSSSQSAQNTSIPTATLNSTNLADLSILLAQHNVTVLPNETLPNTPSSSLSPTSESEEEKTTATAVVVVAVQSTQPSVASGETSPLATNARAVPTTSAAATPLAGGSVRTVAPTITTAGPVVIVNRPRPTWWSPPIIGLATQQPVRRVPPSSVSTTTTGPLVAIGRQDNAIPTTTKSSVILLSQNNAVQLGSGNQSVIVATYSNTTRSSNTSGTGSASTNLGIIVMGVSNTSSLQRPIGLVASTSSPELVGRPVFVNGSSSFFSSSSSSTSAEEDESSDGQNLGNSTTDTRSNETSHGVIFNFPVSSVNPSTSTTTAAPSPAAVVVLAGSAAPASTVRATTPRRASPSTSLPPGGSRARVTWWVPQGVVPVVTRARPVTAIVPPSATSPLRPTATITSAATVTTTVSPTVNAVALVPVTATPGVVIAVLHNSNATDAPEVLSSVPVINMGALFSQEEVTQGPPPLIPLSGILDQSALIGFGATSGNISHVESVLHRTELVFQNSSDARDSPLILTGPSAAMSNVFLTATAAPVVANQTDNGLDYRTVHYLQHRLIVRIGPFNAQESSSVTTAPASGLATEIPIVADDLTTSSSTTVAVPRQFRQLRRLA